MNNIGRLLFVILMAVAFTANAKGVGMVMNVQGEATYLDKGKRVHFDITDPMLSGTTVSVPKESELRFVFYPTSEVYSLSGPAELSIGEKSVTTKSGNSPKVVQQFLSTARVDSTYQGRVVPGALVMRGLEGFAKPSSGQIHGLIMGIGHYEQPTTPLEGVVHDLDSARDIAHRLGVTDQNLKVLKDDALTLDGMRHAFDELEASLSDGDQVFIYYSGHGSRYLALNETPGNRCAEALVSYDKWGLIDTELEARLKRISAKAQKVIFFIDACHSGGVTTRSLAGLHGLTPKYWSSKGTADACEKPTNMLTRSISLAAKSQGSGGANFVYIAAAKDDEVSFDDPQTGGLATQAWFACLNGAAKDLDNSGGLSAEEIRICAQSIVDKRLARYDTLRPSHITITGNSGMVLSYVAKADNASPSPLSGGNSTDPASASDRRKTQVSSGEGPVGGTNGTSQSNASSAQPVSPLATLSDIYNSRDDRRLVTLQAVNPKPRIGKDSVAISFTSREPGFAYLLMVGSDGKVFDILFPNQLDRNNEIRAGETLQLPRPAWQLTAQGPAGKDMLLAIVSDSPRDFASAGMQPSGPFSVIPALAGKDIQLVSGTSANAGSDECKGGQQSRNIAVVKRCSNAYGAAVLVIEEVAK